MKLKNKTTKMELSIKKKQNVELMGWSQLNGKVRGLSFNSQLYYSHPKQPMSHGKIRHQFNEREKQTTAEKLQIQTKNTETT
jgi:hypothetical protein